MVECSRCGWKGSFNAARGASKDGSYLVCIRCHKVITKDEIYEEEIYEEEPMINPEENTEEP